MKKLTPISEPEYNVLRRRIMYSISIKGDEDGTK